MSRVLYSKFQDKTHTSLDELLRGKIQLMSVKLCGEVVVDRGSEKAAKLWALARRTRAGRFITSNERLDGEEARSALP